MFASYLKKSVLALAWALVVRQGLAEAAATGHARFPALIDKREVIEQRTASGNDPQALTSINNDNANGNAEVYDQVDYVVLFHPHVSHEKRDLHQQWLNHLIRKRSYGSPEDNQYNAVQNGIRGYLDGPAASLRGYYGSFDPEVAQHIGQSEDVAIIEKDSYDEAQDFVYLQYNSPWGLGRISNKEFSSDGNGDATYVFNSNAGTNTTLYILDSGVRSDHREFNDRVRWGANFVDGESVDDQGHGTIIAGIAAGYNVGVAKFANIVSVKVIDSQRRASISRIVQGISWIIDDHAKNPGQKAVINYSAVGSLSSSRTLAIQNAVDAGILLVTAAGNSAGDACTYGPSDMGKQDGVITVGALNYTNEAAEFSNYGSCVSVYAPGVSILSSSNDSTTSYRYTSGTSMSSPFVAGLASYFWSINSSYTLADIKDQIVNYNNDQIIGLDSTTPNRIAYNHM